MEFVPVKMIYTAVVQGHSLCARVHYFESYRVFDFYFNENNIASRTVHNDEGVVYQKDDETITDMIRDYCSKNNNLFKDIFVRHSDKVKLVSKEVEVIISEGFVEMTVNVVIRKGKYVVTATTSDDDNKLICEVGADSFSEVFEKLRIFSGVLGVANQKLVSYIDLFSHDDIKESYEWD